MIFFIFVLKLLGISLKKIFSTQSLHIPNLGILSKIVDDFYTFDYKLNC